MFISLSILSSAACSALLLSEADGGARLAVLLSEERHQQQTAVQPLQADDKGIRKDVLVSDVSDVCAQSVIGQWLNPPAPTPPTFTCDYDLNIPDGAASQKLLLI